MSSATCQPIKSNTQPDTNASWFGAAATSAWTFSRGVHPHVPVLVVLILPRPEHHRPGRNGDNQNGHLGLDSSRKRPWRGRNRSEPRRIVRRAGRVFCCGYPFNEERRSHHVVSHGKGRVLGWWGVGRAVIAGTGAITATNGGSMLR